MLGPSDDGGYYLIGMKKMHRRLFEEIDWSTERVFEQTIERARELGVEVHILPTWYDVDDRGDAAAPMRGIARRKSRATRGTGDDAVFESTRLRAKVARDLAS